MVAVLPLVRLFHPLVEPARSLSPSLGMERWRPPDIQCRSVLDSHRYENDSQARRQDARNTCRVPSKNGFCHGQTPAIQSRVDSGGNAYVSHRQREFGKISC